MYIYFTYLIYMKYVYKTVSERGRSMVRIAAGDLRKDVAEVLNKVAYGHERVIVHRRGKDAVAIISLEDLALLEAFEDQLDLKDAQVARREAKERGTVAWNDLKLELGV